jgi:NAD-dependent SIR2 family protein deacetylase
MRILATQSAFDSDPDIVWQWYRERREMIRRAEPNAAHRAVARRIAHAARSGVVW